MIRSPAHPRGDKYAIATVERSVGGVARDAGHGAVATSLQDLSSVALAAGDAEKSVKLRAVAAAVRRAAGVPLGVVEERASEHPRLFARR